MKLLRGRREEPRNGANVRSVCALSNRSPRDNADVRATTAFPSSGALQSSLIDRVPLNCRHKAAYSQAMT